MDPRSRIRICNTAFQIEPNFGQIHLAGQYVLAVGVGKDMALFCDRECDIVEILHMRLTLLQMTFGKHIERKHICFFPGEVRTVLISCCKKYAWIWL